MKKFLFWASTLMLATTLTFSCGDDDPVENPGGGNPEQPIDPVTPDKPLTPAEQKVKMEEVAMDLMDRMPASDFKELTDFAEYVSDTYADYDWDEVDSWAESALEAAINPTDNEYTETEESYGWVYNYIYTEYKALLMASNFTGKFTAANGRWVRSDAKDLQFVFKDKAGAECALKLETSGAVKKVHLGCEDDWTDYESVPGKNVGNDYYDRTEYTIGVPEKIVVTLTKGATQMVKTTVKVDLASISGEEFDIAKSAVNATTLVELNNGYRFEASEVAYKGNAKASGTVRMVKGNETLLTLSMAGDLSGIPSCNVSAFSRDNFDCDFDDMNATNAWVKIDVMGKMQIQGLVSDVSKFADYLEMADENDENEGNFKSYISQANSQMQLFLFYDNKTEKQAQVVLESFVDENYYGEKYWTAEPVIRFFDGTSYSTFSAFFNEKDFKGVIDSFKRLAERYAELVDEEIDW